jgi:ADP-ribose pyrophosphatase YjhB (NUDIX family)
MPIPRAAAVVIDGGRALLIKRYLRHPSAAVCVMCTDAGRAATDDCAGHHYAVLPGGHVEEGETPEETALRELTEETTLRARVERLLWTGLHNDRPATYFLMADVVGEPVLSGPEAAEHCATNSFELLWAGADRFDGLGLHPASVRQPLAELLVRTSGT